MAEGEALVRIHRIGVCGTDLHAFAGRQPFFTYPRVLGHELGVEVVEVAPNERGISVGDRCAVEPYLNNPSSHASRLGRPNCCEELKVLGVHVDGGMCGYLSAPIRLLHKSDTLSFEQLALVETLGIGQHAVERSAIPAGETALVIGAGPIGLAIVQFLQAAGATPVVADLSEPRRRFVAGLGVEAVEPGRPALRLRARRHRLEGLDGEVLRLLRPRRDVGFRGIGAGFDLVPRPELPPQGAYAEVQPQQRQRLPTIIRMIEEGRIDTGPWVNHRLALRNVPTEFAGLRGIPDLVKAVIEVDEGDL